MEINKAQNGGTCVLTLNGRLDTITAPKLQEALAEVMPSCENIELDFAGVAYVSSAGLRVLLMGQKNAHASQKTMRLKNVSSDVMEVFAVTGFSDVLTIG